MLLEFELENWMCFSEPVSINFYAGRTRKHSDRLIRLKRSRERILPITVIYGRNASGKSALFKAINFSKSYISLGTTMPSGRINVDRFALDGLSLEKPSKFSFVILINETKYKYFFAVTNKNVVEEVLTKNFEQRNETVVYSRAGKNIVLNDELENNEFMKYLKDGTRENQLFLTNAIMQNVVNRVPETAFKDVYEWFSDLNSFCLFPDAYRHTIFENDLDKLSELLATMDTGITGLSTGQIVNIEAERLAFPNFHRFVASSNDSGSVIYRRMMSQHEYNQGSRFSKVLFDIERESDGTKRLIDLLPLIVDIMDESKSLKILFMDEISQNLHPLLVRNIVERYLDGVNSNSRTQLIFSTHDTTLLNSKLLRNDEIWFINDTYGENPSRELVSFYDYIETKKDNDLQTSYLTGRMGGIPSFY